MSGAQSVAPDTRLCEKFASTGNGIWMPHLLRTITILLALLAGLIAPALADKRVALVVGNADYRNVPRLLNPRNDAEDMAESLRALGFEVVARTNADRRQFTQALIEFSRAIQGADVALV